jgi:hypothetical protein
MQTIESTEHNNTIDTNSRLLFYAIDNNIWLSLLKQSHHVFHQLLKVTARRHNFCLSCKRETSPNASLLQTACLLNNRIATERLQR